MYHPFSSRRLSREGMTRSVESDRLPIRPGFVPSAIQRFCLLLIFASGLPPSRKLNTKFQLEQERGIA